MPNASLAEIYFIAAMMILIFVVCGVAVYFFFKTFRKEMSEKKLREQAKLERARKAERQFEKENVGD